MRGDNKVEVINYWGNEYHKLKKRVIIYNKIYHI
jgi:hypothetical protein